MKPRPGDLVAGLGGIGLLVAMVLDWYSVDGAFFGAVDAGANAWQAFSVTDVLLALAAVGGIAVFLAQSMSRSPATAVTTAVLATTFAAITTLLVVYRLANQPGGNDVIQVEPGAYLGLITVLAVFYGSALSLRDESARAADRAVPVDERPVPPA